MTDLGIQCFTAPCAAQHEAKLNSTISANIAGFDLTGTDATPVEQLAATEAVFDGHAILIAGTNTTVTGPGGKAKQLAASQFYTQLVQEGAVAGAACGGFIGTVCAAGLYCDITVANACKGADLPGVCKTVPQFCTQIYKPVCGCDGKSYGNDCERLGNQVQLAHAGTCP